MNVLEETINVYVNATTDILQSTSVMSSVVQFVEVADIGGDLDLSGSQDIIVNLNVTEVFQAFRNEETQQSFVADFQEIAEEALNGIDWLQYPDAYNAAHSYINAALNMSTTLEQQCSAEAYVTQGIRIRQVEGVLQVGTITQKAIVDIYMSCFGTAGSDQSAFQDLQRYVTQVATVETRVAQVDWWAILVISVGFIFLLLLLFLLPKLGYWAWGLVPILLVAGGLALWKADLATGVRLETYGFYELEAPSGGDSMGRQTLALTANTCQESGTCAGFTYTPEESVLYRTMPDPLRLVDSSIPLVLGPVYEGDNVIVMEQAALVDPDYKVVVDPSTMNLKVGNRQIQFSNIEWNPERVLYIVTHPPEEDSEGWFMNVSDPVTLELWVDGELMETVAGPGWRENSGDPPTVGAKVEIDAFDWNWGSLGIMLLSGAFVSIIVLSAKHINDAKARKS